MIAFIDGIGVDLDRVLVAVDGTRWLWTCDVDASGHWLMAPVGGYRGAQPICLDAVIRGHGPVTPERKPTTAAMYRQVLESA